MKNFIKILLLFFGFIAINFLSEKFNARIDLTDEKKYTLTEPVKKLLQGIDNEIFVKVYLTGSNLPNGFKRLEGAIKQTLDEFQSVANSKISYRFVDLNNEIKDDKTREDFIAELATKGIPPTNVIVNKSGNKSQNLVVPGAIISFQDKELAVNFLKGNKLATPQETLNQAYEGVEYELASAIKQISQTEKKKIGFFVNYSTLPAIRQIDLINTLKKNYDLFPVDLAQSTTLDGLDAIFVMKPDKQFSDSDKFKIDQFIVKGGKALFFIDPVKIDSLGGDGNFVKPFSVNLEDLFFKYGIRLNTNLLKDNQMNAMIPLNVGNVGNTADIKLIHWAYFPLVNNFGISPIVRNLDAVCLKYVSTIDTVRALGITKTPLLQSSQYTQTINAPATISYTSAAKDFDAKKANGGVKTVSYLLEGNFESLYTNTILPTDSSYASFKSKYKASKIIICADGDVPTNDIDEKRNQPLPLGFDKYSRNTFANKDFVKNAVDYLLDPNGIIASRNKTVVLRPLDKIEITQNQTKWQAINLLIPFGLLAIMGFLFSFVIKRKYFQN